MDRIQLTVQLESMNDVSSRMTQSSGNRRSKPEQSSVTSMWQLWWHVNRQSENTPSDRSMNIQQYDNRIGKFLLTSDKITLSGSECRRSSKLLLTSTRCCGDSCWRITFTSLKSPLQRRRSFSSLFCCSSTSKPGPKSAALRRYGWSRRNPPGPSAGLRKSALNSHSEKISRARLRRCADGEFDERSSRSSRSCTKSLLFAVPVHGSDNSSENPASPRDSGHGRLGPRDGGVNTGVETLCERGGKSFILEVFGRSAAHIDDAAFHRAENMSPLLTNHLYLLWYIRQTTSSTNKHNTLHFPHASCLQNLQKAT